MHHPLILCRAAWPSRALPTNYRHPGSRRSQLALPDQEARGPENDPLRHPPGRSPPCLATLGKITDAIAT